MNTPTSLTITFLLFATATTVVGQGARVIPAPYAYVEGTTRHTYPFGRQQAQMQILTDPSELMATQGSLFGLLFRADGHPAITYPGHAKGYKVTLTSTPVTAAQMTTDPVANRGNATGSVVFNAGLNLPTDPPVVPLPRGYPFRIPFTGSFSWRVSQGSLLVHVETTDLTTPPGAWILDAAERGTSVAHGVGTLISNGCRNAANDALSLNVAHAGAIVGGSWSVTPATSRAGAFPVAIVILGFTNQSPWPLDLGFLGMTGCSLDVEPFFAAPLTETSGTYPTVGFPIPADPSLAWWYPLCVQGLGWALPNQSFVGSVTSSAHVTLIGDAQAAPASYQSIFYDAAQQTWLSSGPGIAVTPVLLLEGLFF